MLGRTSSVLEQPPLRARLDATGMKTPWCWQDPHTQPQAPVQTEALKTKQHTPAGKEELGQCPQTQLVEVTHPGAPAGTRAEPVGSLGPALPGLCSSWAAPQARQLPKSSQNRQGRGFCSNCSF